jgi:hypothetical protein
LALLAAVICSPVLAGTLTITLNGLEIGLDEENGGLVRLDYEPIGTILQTDAASAGGLDVAYPIADFVPLRLAGRHSKAEIIRADNSVTIRWAKLGPSRPNFKLPEGQVGAEMQLAAGPDGRSVIVRCKIENRSSVLIPQVLFPDLRGLRPIDGPATTQLRFAGNYPVFPFTEDPIPAHTAQFYVNSGWREYPPSTGVYGINTLRWLDFGGYKGGLSVFQKAWGAAERPVVRTYRSQADLSNLRLMWDYKRGIKPGETWESDEVWLTPHRGGWAKGIEPFREYVRTKHPERKAAAHIRDGLGMQTIFLIQAPERDPAYAAFKFKDIPRVAADAKAHGLDEICMWGWCEYFTLPFKVRPELGTAEDLVEAVREAKAIGVNVSPFVSCYLQQNKNAERYGGAPGGPAWVYHPEMVPTMDPYYVGAGYPLQYWNIFSIDPRNKNYHADVLATFKDWIDRGVTSWSWDQVFADPPGSGGLTDLLFEVRSAAHAKDPELAFSGEQVTNLEYDNGLLDYTWNWLDHVDAGPMASVMRTPRLNCNIEDSPRIVKAAFADNLWINAFPRKPDQPNGTALVSDKPALSAALKQVAALRKQFLPYFVEGTYLGDSVLSEPAPAFVRAYQLGDKLLIIVINNQAQPAPIKLTCTLGLWLRSPPGYSVQVFDGHGKSLGKEQTTQEFWSTSTEVLQPLDLVLFEISRSKDR